MNSYENGRSEFHTSVPDVLAMQVASFAEEDEPMSAMFASAVIYSQDADQKLEDAKAMRDAAGKFRSEMQKTTKEQTEALCQQMREEAEQELTAARDTHAKTGQSWDAACAELERATATRDEAEAYRTATHAETESHRAVVVEQAELEALGMKKAVREQASAEIADQQAAVDQEIRRALASIDKMQEAVKAELEAQQMYKEALRFRAASPKREEAAEPAHEIDD
jgi:hypothetical protein